MSTIGPYRTALTNILLPNPIFSTDSIGGLAALSQLSPQSFDSSQPTLAEAFLLGSGFLSQTTPLKNDIFEAAAISTEVPISMAPPPLMILIADEREPHSHEDRHEDRFERHPLGGPPGQLKKRDHNF